MTVEAFVEKLASAADNGRLIHNPYRREACRDNLLHYLRHLRAAGVDVMLVGEAPGYRGCALTGIPFTDEAQLKRPENRYALGAWERPASCGDTAERTAGAIWPVLREYQIVPLLWNAFPFHPYQAGKEASNRAPTRGELAEGMEYLDDLRAIFQIDERRLFAVGQSARRALGISDPRRCIRHPSYDCKKEFPLQFREKVGTCRPFA